MNSKVNPETVKLPVRAAQAACDKALLEASTEALAMKMYRLMEIVKLAAYAAGSGMNTKEADTSEVLYFVADELEGVSCDFTQTIYEMARAKNGGAA